jgi:two-component system sensor histidine kinase MprB
MGGVAVRTQESTRAQGGHLVAGVWNYYRRKPLQRRVTVLMTAAMAVAVLLSNGAGYIALEHTLTTVSENQAMRGALDLVGPAATSLRQSGQLDAEVKQVAGVVVEAVDPAGRMVGFSGAPELVIEAEDLASAGVAGQPHRRTGVDTGGRAYTVASVPVEDTGYALVVARPRSDVAQVLERERLILFLVVATSILAAAGASFFVARAGLRPVRELAATVEQVAETRDFQPIAIGYVAGDLATLAGAFNQLLRSVSQMRERQVRLVADAGHELRTPLTSLTTNVELLSSDLRTNHLPPDQRSAILGDVRGQLSELTDLVNDLVQLSRGDVAGTFRPVDLREPVAAAVERVRRRAGDRVLDVQVDELHLVGDAAALERLVTNLLDNAVKWSPPGGTIRVRLRGNRLHVADSGPGIAAADLPYVFDRFFRGETARQTHGTGLGLSIVAKTAEDHGGTVSVGRSNDGGAEFTVQLPGVTHREALPGLLVPAG